MFPDLKEFQSRQGDMYSLKSLKTPSPCFPTIYLQALRPNPPILHGDIYVPLKAIKPVNNGSSLLGPFTEQPCRGGSTYLHPLSGASAQTG